MEKFYFEIPGISRKEDAIDYIREFLEYGSEINGAGGLHRFLDDYEGWLKKLDLDYTMVPRGEGTGPDVFPGAGKRFPDCRDDQYPPGAQ